MIRLGAVAAGFLVSVIAARLLGPADLGIAGTALALATVAALAANAGLSMSAIYLLRRAGADLARVGGALTSLSIVLIGLAAAGAGILVAPYWLLEPRMSGLTVIAAAAAAAATVAIETSGAQLLGIGRNRAYAAAEGIRSWATLAATALTLALAPTPAGYLAGAAMGMLVATGYAHQRIRAATGPSALRVDRGIWGDALRFGLRGQAGNILQFFTLRIDLVFVAAILGPAPAGIYVVASRVSEVVTQIANAAASLLFPAVASQTDASDTARTARTVRLVCLAVAASALVIAVVSVPLLNVVFGPAFGPGAPALWLLLVAAIPLSLGRLLAGDLKGRGRPGLVSLAALAGLVITAVGNLALLPSFGIEVAAAVSIASYSATALLLALAYRRVTGARLRALVPGPTDAASLLRLAIDVAGALRPARLRARDGDTAERRPPPPGSA